MADSKKLAQVVAMLAERDDDFRPLNGLVVATDENSGESYWSLSRLCALLSIQNPSAIATALDRAKIAASKAGMSIKEHFQTGNMFVGSDDVVLSKYAGYLFVMNCDPEHGKVGVAQVYFALQVDRQCLEDERRLKARLDVATENHKLAGVAQDSGVKDFARFNGVGVSGLYGGLSVDQIKARKQIPKSASHLDFAGSEELAANLFRITQTRAALVKKGVKSETIACQTHHAVAVGIRDTIKRAGNTLPENLPAAPLKIDQVASATQKKVIAQKSQIAGV